jgi:hypothetical protein
MSSRRVADLATEVFPAPQPPPSQNTFGRRAGLATSDHVSFLGDELR